jgi:hypothetical protein
MRVEVVDAETGEAILGAQVVYATSIYGPRHDVDDELGPGKYWVWARAPGYWQDVDSVEVESVCVAFEDPCPPQPTYTVALERRP